MLSGSLESLKCISSKLRASLYVTGHDVYEILDYGRRGVKVKGLRGGSETTVKKKHIDSQDIISFIKISTL